MQIQFELSGWGFAVPQLLQKLPKTSLLHEGQVHSSAIADEIVKRIMIAIRKDRPFSLLEPPVFIKCLFVTAAFKVGNDELETLVGLFFAHFYLARLHASIVANQVIPPIGNNLALADEEETIVFNEFGVLDAAVLCSQNKPSCLRCSQRLQRSCGHPYMRTVPAFIEKIACIELRNLCGFILFKDAIALRRFGIAGYAARVDTLA